MLQACLNGARSKVEHPSIPVTPEELARDAASCAAAGAGAIHFHPRAEDGAESLHPEVVNGVVAKVREVCSVPLCVTTGGWIEPDVARRVEYIRGWTAPDLATVNLSEEGSLEVIEALLAAGVDVEAGVSELADVKRLTRSGTAGRVARVLVEPVDVAASDAEQVVAAIHAALDEEGIAAPRLQHGDGEATWPLVRDAIRRGIDTRIGFEDTLWLPDGRTAGSNEELVAAARAAGA